MFAKITALLARATEPSSKIKGVIERIEARALATLALVLVFTVAALALFFVFGFRTLDELGFPLISSAITAVLLIPVYVLARTSRFRSAAGFLWGLSYCVVLATAVLQPRETAAIQAMSYLVVPMIIGSLFFSSRINAALFFVSLLGVFAFGFLHSDMERSDLFSMLGYIFTVGVAVFASTVIRRKTSEVVGNQQLLMTQYSKLAAMGEMAAGVAHEINNPLAIIKLNIEKLNQILDQSAHDERELKESLLMISKTGDRIAKIVQGLLSVSREGGHAPLGLISIRFAIDQVLSLCQERFTRQGVQLTVVAPDPTLMVWGNTTQVEQILMNLLNNAFDAVQSGSHPRGGEKWIRVVVTPLKEDVKIQVSNSGPPIDARVREKIFQPFFTTKPPGKGTGLGLSISRSLAETQAGSLNLLTQTKGPTFELRLRSSAPPISH